MPEPVLVTITGWTKEGKFTDAVYFGVVPRRKERVVHKGNSHYVTDVAHHTQTNNTDVPVTVVGLGWGEKI